MIAGKTQHIADSQCGCAEKVGLEGDTVSVACDQMIDRFDTGAADRNRSREAGQNRPVRISGDIYRGNTVRNGIEYIRDSRAVGYGMRQVFRCQYETTIFNVP